MRRILVFGATGGTGREIVRQALIRGDLEVTAFARNPLDVEPASRLRVVGGDALNADAVAAAMDGQNAVLSALGSRTAANATLLAHAIPAIVAAMNDRGIRRLIVLGAAGALDMNEALQHQNARTKVMYRTVAATVLSAAMHDHATQERLLRESDLDYTIVHAARLLDEPQTGNYRVESDGLPAGATTISRGDVAEFMLDQLDTSKHLRKAPYIGV